MGAGVATVGRRPYAVGLYWENSPSGRISQAAKEAARQPGQQAEFYAVRAGNKGGRTPQFGLSPIEVGHKAGMPAFAACLANQQPGSWAGAFRLREGTVVAVVRDDLIVPDGDQFYTDEAEARDRLLQEIGFGGLQRIYAPEAWAVPGADTMPVSLLMSERTDVRLRRISLSKKTIVFGAIAAVILLLILGVGWYLQVEQEKEAQHQRDLNEIRRQAESMLPSALQSTQVKYPDPDPKWKKRPKPMEVIQVCYQALQKVPAAIGGWHMTDMTCNESSLNTVWQRDSGFSKPPSSFSINESGQQATFSVNLSAINPRGEEGLEDPDVVTRLYLAQNWPGTIARIPDDPPPHPPLPTIKANGIHRRRHGLSVLLPLQCQSYPGIRRLSLEICRASFSTRLNILQAPDGHSRG